ncbi:uncharacterized protein LDX57_003624 [Aspergillus melleus]|uniref:uncharacterized protein n=1 Tax=Aspergillus melleus TaxID=138277 RepID=UPI001E8D56E4|nr:uncharacterized protein LDX57_003624 [Aspergillus melleus]KAH8425886.1 hypothetical protein LDX57_003624 [Aspergillus melleus]
MVAAKKLLLIFSKRDGQLLNHPGLPVTDSCPFIPTNKKSFVFDTYLLLQITSEIQNNPAAYGGYVFHMSFQDDNKKFLYAILQKGDSADTGTECDADDFVPEQNCVRNNGWADPAENDAHDPRGDCAAESVWGLPVTLEKPACHEAIKEYESSRAAFNFTHAHPNPLRLNRTHKHTKRGAQSYAESWHKEPRNKVIGWCTDGENRDWETSGPEWSCYGDDESNHDNRPGAAILTPESTESDDTFKPKYVSTASGANYGRGANGVTGKLGNGYDSDFDASAWSGQERLRYAMRVRLVSSKPAVLSWDIIKGW